MPFHRIANLTLKTAALGATVTTVHLTRRAILLEEPASADRGSSWDLLSQRRKERSGSWMSLLHNLPKQLCQFIDASPSPHHVVDNAKELLRARGFTELHESEPWNVEAGGKYFVNRCKDSGNSLAAFAVGEKWEPGDAFAIVGTHVDSPCLRLKPHSRRFLMDYTGLGVELYGGGLWHTWFDRDLGMAGRVIVRTGPDSFETKLLNVDTPVLRIPSLAAHYRQHNPLKIDLERALIPIMGSEQANKAWKDEHGDQSPSELESEWISQMKTDYRPSGLDQYSHESVADLISDRLGVPIGSVLDVDLCLYDLQPASIGGIHNEYIFSARLDNLMMTFCGLSGLVKSLESPAALKDDKTVRMLVMFDDEEIGSVGAGAAKSTFVPHILKRIGNEKNTQGQPAAAPSEKGNSFFERSMAKSFFVSADMVHAVHPVHSQHHEAGHRIYPNKGLVISSSHRHSFVHNVPGRFLMREVAMRSTDLLPPQSERNPYLDPDCTGRGSKEAKNVAEEPTAAPLPPKLQYFVNPNDVSCGSTIGPHFASMSGIRTIDVGNAQLSMHSTREMAGAEDIGNAIALMAGFYREFSNVDQNMDVK